MSFGSAFGAIVSLKNNRRKISGRTEKHISGKESISGVKSHRTPSKKELLEIRTRMLRENRQRQLRTAIISAIILLLFLMVFCYFMFF